MNHRPERLSGERPGPRLNQAQKSVLMTIIGTHPELDAPRTAAMFRKATGCQVGTRTIQRYRRSDDQDEPTEPAPLAEPGGVIAEFRVPIRPVPWKVPTVTRNGTYKEPSLIFWQSAVARAAWIAMAQRRPYEGRVGIDFAFTLVDAGRPLPDLTNLIKSTEDAIQGTVIANDKAVGEIRATRVAGAENGATIRVYALGGNTP